MLRTHFHRCHGTLRYALFKHLPAETPCKAAAGPHPIAAVRLLWLHNCRSSSTCRQRWACRRLQPCKQPWQRRRCIPASG